LLFYAYDALGRRIKAVDSVASATTLYYYNTNWQVLCEKNAAGTTLRWCVYGNYIDEPIMMVAGANKKGERYVRLVIIKT